MAGPFPVVCIASKFSDALCRCANQSDIFITLVDICQILVAFEMRDDGGDNIVRWIT